MRTQQEQRPIFSVLTSSINQRGSNSSWQVEAFDRGNSTEHIRACVKQWKCVNHWVLEEIRASWETRGAESVGDSANEQWGNCRAQTECPKIAWAMMGQAVHSIQSTSCPKLASTESSGLDQDLTVHHLVPKVHWRCLSFFHMSGFGSKWSALQWMGLYCMIYMICIDL